MVCDDNQCHVDPVIVTIYDKPEIFGNDTQAFRPERWLSSDPDRQKLMRQNFYTFSAGHRACIGQKSVAWRCVGG